MKKLLFALLIVCCFLSAAGTAFASGSHVAQKSLGTLNLRPIAQGDSTDLSLGCQAVQSQLATFRYAVGSIKADLYDPLDQSTIVKLSAALSRYSGQAGQAQVKLSDCLTPGTDPAHPACQAYQDQLTQLHDAIQAIKADLSDSALSPNDKAADAAAIARLQKQTSQVQAKLTACLNAGAQAA